MYRVVAKDFPNALGKFTPCFTNIAVLGESSKEFFLLQGFMPDSHLRCLITRKPHMLISTITYTCAVTTAGTAHVTAIILCIIRMALARQTKGAEKYRLRGSAKLVHCCAATAAAANLLLVLFLLNGRIAADTILVVHGKVAPFEWVGESIQILVA